MQSGLPSPCYSPSNPLHTVRSDYRCNCSKHPYFGQYVRGMSCFSTAMDQKLDKQKYHHNKDISVNDILQRHPSAAQSALNASSEKELRVPCYCEENVWRLVFRKLHHDAKSETTMGTTRKTVSYYVIFISNPKGCVPMFHQLACSNRDKPVFWDYHVILLSRDRLVAGSSLIWDMDSDLPFPCPFHDYVRRVFPNPHQWPVDYTPYFRVIDAFTFLQHFSSDRSHMMIGNGEWSATPPTYNCIVPSNVLDCGSSAAATNNEGDQSAHTSTLRRYMVISKDDVMACTITSSDHQGFTNHYGAVCSLTQLLEKF